jgi:hypothetical protein
MTNRPFFNYLGFLFAKGNMMKTSRTLHSSLILLSAVFVFLLFVSAVSADPPAGQKWKLVWGDEFNDPIFDLTKWDYRLGARGDAIWVKEAVTLDGKGNLVLRSWDDKGQVYGGAITSSGHFTHRYGYYEARCILPKYDGHWSAFWLQTPKQGVPPYGPAVVGSEVDIFEYFNVGGDIISQNVHWGCNTDFYEHMGHEAEVPGLGKEGYHTFGLLWTPEEYVFYVDGQETWRTHRGISHLDLYVIFSDEILYKTWIKSGGFPADYKYLEDFFIIDYVRVYDVEDELAPPADKKDNFLQMVEILTSEENAKLLRSGVMEHLSQVIHSPGTQLRQFPLIDFKEDGEIGDLKFRDNKVVDFASSDDLPFETLDVIYGSMECLTVDKTEVSPVLHLRADMKRRTEWTTDASGKKTPIVRYKRGHASRQVLNPATWYVLSDSVDTVDVNGKPEQKRAMVLYRLFTSGKPIKKITTQPAQPAIPVEAENQ